MYTPSFTLCTTMVDFPQRFMCGLIHKMENEMVRIAIYAIEEQCVVLVTNSMMGNANNSMFVETVIVFNFMDQWMEEGIIMG